MQNRCCEEAARRIAALEAELHGKQDRLIRALAEAANLRVRLKRVVETAAGE